jgi:hypothetical protein
MTEKVVRNGLMQFGANTLFIEPGSSGRMATDSAISC